MPLQGVTKSGRVWRKVPESDAWSVVSGVYVFACMHARERVCVHAHSRQFVSKNSNSKKLYFTMIVV